MFSQALQAYKNYNSDITDKFAKQTRLQRQFLDMYPQFRNFEERAGLEASLKAGEIEEQPFYFKLLSESLIQADTKEGIDRFESDFIKTRAFMEIEKANALSDRKQNFHAREVREAVWESIQASMSARLRPYPESWEDDIRGQRFVDQYMKSLKPEQKKNIEELIQLWKNRMALLDNTMRDHYLDYKSF